MICKKCSKEIPDDAKMCCYCGRKYIIERKNTKRAKGEGTAYKRGNTWTAQVTIGWKELPPLDLNIPENTKRRVQIHRTKGGFKTKNEALLYCRELMAQKEKPKAAPHLITYWKTYEDGSFQELSKSKQTVYKAAWEKLKDIHETPVDALTVAGLRELVARKCPTYYPARDCKTILRALFRMAGADGYANKDLPEFIDLPSLEEKEQVPFSTEDQKKPWQAYENGDMRACIPLLMIHTGMMPGEAMKLKVENIDLTKRQIYSVGIKTKVRKQTPISLSMSIMPVINDLIEHAQKNGYIWPRNESA